MPTRTEKRALVFFAGVFLLGAGVRVVGATGEGAPPADAGARVELHRQIEAVDSARRAGGKGRGSRRPRAARGDAADSAGPARTRNGGMWRPDTAPTRVYYLSPRRARLDRLGTDSGDGGRAAASFQPGFEAPARVDLDVATEAEIERLPRIGPALARRIVEDRAARGPFGSLEGLTRVRGIGPATARAIAPYVTFTLTPRPSSEGDGAPGATGGRGRRLRKPRTP